MAPCRDLSGKVSQLYSMYCSNMTPLPTSADIKSNNNEENMATTTSVRCCYPDGECLKMDAIITADQLIDCVRVICNNENCLAGEFMHRQCFEAWEQGILVKAVGGNGRAARQWSERQRNQNLWSKKGFELVHKVCQCKCGSGHIRKDLEWVAPVNNNGTNLTKNAQITNGQQQQQLQSQQQRFVNGCVIAEDEEKKKRKKKNRNHANQQQQQQQQQKLPLSVLSSNNVSNVQQQQQQQISGKQINDVNGDNVTATHGNVGVIGSGLQHHNNNNVNNQMNLQQQQQQMITSTLNNILNSNNSLNTSGNNILGLDLRARASSLSSGADGGSGTTSPSTSLTSGELSVWKPIQLQEQQQQQQQQQMHHIPLLTQQYMVTETVPLSPQQLQQQQMQQHNCLLQQHQQNMNGLSKTILNGITSNVNTTAPLLMKSQIEQQKQEQQQQALIKQQLSLYDQQHLIQQQKNKEVELYSERVRATSGCNGIFSRRLDFSSFNQLPKTRLNSYQVKIEDEGNHGNDETRLFILSSLAQSQMSRVACILCEDPMLVFDRYPLVDGSFFLSPKQHSPGCIEVKYESRVMYLTSVCMSCLDGTTTNRIITCRFCGEIWDGSNLVLGTMYAYDIFAAMPCCNERIKCNHCSKLLLHPQQRLNFYSDYSHAVTCQHCGTQDTHFVKPLNYCYIKSPSMHQHGQIA